MPLQLALTHSRYMNYFNTLFTKSPPSQLFKSGQHLGMCGCLQSNRFLAVMSETVTCISGLGPAGGRDLTRGLLIFQTSPLDPEIAPQRV